jgi:hypothetical protein
MRTILVSAIAIAATFPAWAAHGGGGMNHGADVSQAAHAARMSGSPVGPSVRSVARSNSQGPAHASQNAISHVQNSPGNAANNSVLGGASPLTATKVKGKGKIKARTGPAQ